MARLTGAHLRQANLHKANVQHADFSEADLRGANLRDTILAMTNFTGADLRGADLTGARLAENVFGDTNLKDVQGLDACDHSGPSTLDYRTLAKSGPLPVPFLRGCGLPDEFIDYLPSLLNQPIQFYSCFISYSTKGQALADRLYADLQNKGVRCWFAPHNLQGG